MLRAKRYPPKRSIQAQAVLNQYRRFYVDATAGNDSNSGRSDAAPWQTIGKINSYTGFHAGDRILFKKGETWLLTAALTVPADNLWFGAYGNGNKPILNGQNTVNCINGNSKNGLRFENLDVRNGLDFGMSGFTNSRDIVVVDCNASACGNDNLLFGATTNVTIKGLTSFDPYLRVADGRLVTCLEFADGCDTALVTGSEFYGSAAMGISIHAHAGQEIPSNITFTNCTFHNNAQSGINISIAQVGGLCTGQKNIVFDDCEFYSNTQSGIKIGAIDPNYPSGITIKNSRSYSNTLQSILATGDNITLQRTVFAGNNVSFASCKNLRLLNCTIYNSTNAAAVFAVSGARTENFYGRNNIINNDVLGQVIISIPAGTGTTGWDMDYNLYRRKNGLVTDTHWNWLGVSYNWANWKTQTTKDADSPTPAEPLFTDASTLDFTLQAGSPAIDVGTTITGVTEGYLGAAPDCGYAEKA